MGNRNHIRRNKIGIGGIRMKDLIEIEQSLNRYECLIKCSDMVKSFKVTFDNNRVDTLEVELKEEKEDKE